MLVAYKKHGEFKNILNSGVAINNFRVLNTDKALNAVQEVVFKSTDDILRILQTHPDFHKATKEAYEPLLAGLLSAALGDFASLYRGSEAGPLSLVRGQTSTRRPSASNSGPLYPLSFRTLGHRAKKR